MDIPGKEETAPDTDTASNAVVNENSSTFSVAEIGILSKRRALRTNLIRQKSPSRRRR